MHAHLLLFLGLFMLELNFTACDMYVKNAGGVVCTYSECSANKPCPWGAQCDDGYCCETTTMLSSPVAASARLIRNCPDNTPSLNLACAMNSECPNGYNCPLDVGACCKISVAFAPPKIEADIFPDFTKLLTKSAFPDNRRHQYSMAPPVAGATAISPCFSECPRGYTGCCGTQQISCCLQQNTCPGGLAPTGRSCYTNCPSGQTCVAGVCCPQLTCPGGIQAIGSCSNGFCGQGYACVRPLNLCCAIIQPVLTCANSARAVGQCISGQCGTGFSCDLSNNLCCPGVSQTSRFICPDGSQAAGSCIGGLCGATFSCVNDLCCRGRSTGFRCLDGSTPLGTCMNGLCPFNFQCSIGDICCPTGNTSSCPTGGNALGPCVGGLCPLGHTCNVANNQCCPSTAGSATCPAGANALGPCIGDQCPLGYDCILPAHLCCQRATGGTATCPVGTVVAGPTINGDCPLGFITAGNICCQRVRLHRSPLPVIESRVDRPRNQHAIFSQFGSCPNGEDAIGPCIGGLCSTGFTCISNLCCSKSTLFRSNACPNGQPSISACFPGGRCIVGYVCDTHTNLCCSPTKSPIDDNVFKIDFNDDSYLASSEGEGETGENEEANTEKSL